MSDEAENKFEDVPTQQEEAAETPSPEAVHNAVKQALAQEGVTKIMLAQCPCGAPEANLSLDIPQGQKVGRATCGNCGTWGVDFLVPRVNDQEAISRVAAKAWNEAPRG